VLKNTNFVFLTALSLGLLAPNLASILVDYVLIVLIVIMTLSTTQIALGYPELKKQSKKVFWAFAVHYLLLSGIILIASFKLLSDPYLIAGFIIMAAVPPAIAVIPLTKLLEGDVSLSLIANTVIYLGSPFIAPVIVYVAGSEIGIDTSRLIEALLELIVLPLIFSRILKRMRFYSEVRVYEIHIINLCFFILIYSVVGVNRGFFFRSDIVYMVTLVGILRTFLSGSLVFVISKFAGVEKSSAISYTLLGSFKNLGLTAIMALTLLGEKASIPAVICIPLELLSFTYFSWLFKKYF